MRTAPLTFVHVGYGNAVCVNRVVAVMLPNASASKRRMKQAKDTDRFLDQTFGRSVKSLLLMDDGAVVGCGITPKTMLARIAGETGNTDCKDTVEGADSDEEMLDPRG